MEVIKITDNITHIKYATAEDMNNAFCRITAQLECPEFKDKVFTLGQYRQYYSDHNGGWTYATDWAGHNIPSKGLEPFMSGLFDPLTTLEQHLLDTVRSKKKPFYVIGTYKDARDGVLEHEVAHALYGVVPTYTKAVQALLAKYKTQLGAVKTMLADYGYHKDTFTDEMHAYIGVDYKHLDKNQVKYPEALSISLRNLFKKHCPKLAV